MAPCAMSWEELRDTRFEGERECFMVVLGGRIRGYGCREEKERTAVWDFRK